MFELKRDLILKAFASIVAVFVFSHSLVAESLRVPQEYSSIQAALIAASSGDVIRVAPGEYPISQAVDLTHIAIGHQDPSEESPFDVSIVGEGGPGAVTLIGTQIDAPIMTQSRHAKGLLTIEGLTFTGAGKGVTFYHSPVFIKDCIFENLNGRALDLNRGLIENSTIQNCTGGGAILHHSEMISCVIEGNSTTFRGGGIKVSGNSLVKDCVIQGNKSVSGGGGLDFFDGAGDPVIDGCQIIGNTAGQDGGGIAIEEYFGITISNCWIEGNFSPRAGGLTSHYGDVSLSNCLFAGNANNAILVELTDINLASCTIADNKEFGLVFLGDGEQAARVVNSIFWKNGKGAFPRHPCDQANDREICRTPLFDTTILQPEDQQDEELAGALFIDPQFIREGNYNFDQFDKGFPQFIIESGDYHLNELSEARSIGVSRFARETDLLGNGRKCGDGVDLGAFQSGFCPPRIPFKRGDADQSELVDITDAILSLQGLFFAGPPPLCEDALDTNDDGLWDITDGIHVLSVLFLGVGEIAPPGMNSCGIDETIDGIHCQRYDPCELDFSSRIFLDPDHPDFTRA